MGTFICDICKKDINERPEWVISDLRQKLSLQKN